MSAPVLDTPVRPQRIEPHAPEWQAMRGPAAEGFSAPPSPPADVEAYLNRVEEPM
jgi:hypothetical protein